MEEQELYIIPNYKGLCWFNALMMALIYSNYSRKLLLTESQEWTNENSNKFQMLIKKLILLNSLYSSLSLFKLFKFLFINCW